MLHPLNCPTKIKDFSKKMPISFLLTVCLIVVFFVSSPPNTVDAKTLNDKKDNKKDKNKDDKKNVEETLDFPMLKEYGRKKYQGDSEFKEVVDHEYEKLQRQHQQTAFIVNVQPPIRVLGDLEGEGGNRSSQYNGAVAASNDGPKDALYENPMLQDYINRVGQSLVPAKSTRLYAFRILQDPLPRAESLSTGTIYISTGLLGMLDNEAQLAYILSHEIAHVEKEHWKSKALIPIAFNEYNEEKAEEENKRKSRNRRLIRLIGIGAGGAVGGVTGAASFGQLGYAASLQIKDVVPSKIDVIQWDPIDEDEADKMAFENCLANNYDVQEIPKLYSVVKTATTSDPRVGLGFMGASRRVTQRVASAEKQLVENKAKIQELSGQGKLIGSRSDFEILIAEVKRDNGVIAFYYDMFDMARRNLEWSLKVRSDDAKAHYYFGRVLKITARNVVDKERALNEFSTALKLDQKRGSLPGVRLQIAIALMDLREASKQAEITENLKEYIRLYKLNNSGSIPPNMDILYDYMTQAGDKNWFTPPTINISTQDVLPVNVQAQDKSKLLDTNTSTDINTSTNINTNTKANTKANTSTSTKANTKTKSTKR